MKPARDKNYLKYVTLFPCAVCHSNKTVPHHFGRTGKGMGQKCSDYETVPLCMVHHCQVHQAGNKKFQNLHGIDFEKISKMIYKNFTTNETGWKYE